MTLDQMFGRMRQLVGNPSVTEVSERDLMEHLENGLGWLAEQLAFEVIDDDMVGVEASQTEVPLPADLIYIVSVMWNDQVLEPVSHWDMERDNWRSSAAGTPSRYAVVGRRMILNPPPDSTAITTDATLSWRYISGDGRINASGVPSLSHLDQQLVCYEAAINWLAAHPVDENVRKIQLYEAQVAKRLPQARKRWQNPVKPHHPVMRPDTSHRGGGGR